MPIVYRYLLKLSFWLVFKSADFARDLIISVILYGRINISQLQYEERWIL
jgi:hypothetical protein